MSSSTPFHHHLGSNPWIFLNPSCANALLLLFVGFVFIIDLIVILAHLNITLCSDILKFWIIGKYFAPLLSYLSCCCFVPCNFDETMDVTTSIPYSQHELRQQRMKESLFINTITEIRKNNQQNINSNSNSNSNSISIPYPYDIMLSEWFVSPSTITSNIASSHDTSLFCKMYIYLIGIIFDRGVLELIWVFIGAVLIICEDNQCKNHTPILYYYVSLQIVLGSFITLMLASWIVSISACPLQVARCMACCYGMECDILGLLPRHLFQRLLTMSSSLNNSDIHKQNQYQNSLQISKNYHTLSTVPHQYQNIENDATDIVELTTSITNKNQNQNQKNNKNKLICEMCSHSLNEYVIDEITTLDCGHIYHSLCVDAWPINLQCPKCKNQNNQNKQSIFEMDDNNKEYSDVDDSDNELEPYDTDNIQNNTHTSVFGVDIQL